MLLWKFRADDRRRFTRALLSAPRRTHRQSVASIAAANGRPVDMQVAISALHADLYDIRSDAERACEKATARKDAAAIEECERTIWAVETLLGSVTDSPSREVTIDYTDARGERGLYRVLPVEIVYSSNLWHLEPQWLLQAVDERKKALRSFAIKDIHAWRPDRTNDNRIENDGRQ
jgi:predicted DNA-binding transcriptional regulator YafY